MSKRKSIKKKSLIKPRQLAQTYVEDTFDFENIEIKNEIIIENNVNVINKKIVSEKDLLNNKQFDYKLKVIISKIEFEKSFEFLFDYVKSSQLYRIYYIDENKDEYDIILDKISLHYIKRLAKINLNYNDYKNILFYFDNLKRLYGLFKRASFNEKEELNKILKKINTMHDYVATLIF